MDGWDDEFCSELGRHCCHCCFHLPGRGGKTSTKKILGLVEGSGRKDGKGREGTNKQVRGERGHKTQLTSSIGV